MVTLIVINMNADTVKLRLVKQLLETDDKELMDHLTAVFDTQNNGWWDNLPPEIKKSVERGIAQADAGDTIPHEEARKVY